MVSPILYVLLWLFLNVSVCVCCSFFSSDGHDGHDDRNVQRDGHDGHDDRGDRGVRVGRPERILWQNNEVAYALHVVYDVRFLREWGWRQVL